MGTFVLKRKTFAFVNYNTLLGTAKKIAHNTNIGGKLVSEMTAAERRAAGILKTTTKEGKTIFKQINKEAGVGSLGENTLAVGSSGVHMSTPGHVREFKKANKEVYTAARANQNPSKMKAGEDKVNMTEMFKKKSKAAREKSKQINTATGRRNEYLNNIASGNTTMIATSGGNLAVTDAMRTSARNKLNVRIATGKSNLEARKKMAEQMKKQQQQRLQNLQTSNKTPRRRNSTVTFNNGTTQTPTNKTTNASTGAAKNTGGFFSNHPVLAGGAVVGGGIMAGSILQDHNDRSSY